MTYAAIAEIAHRTPAEWQWLPLKRVVTLRREPNSQADAVLLSLSASRGVEPRPEDGGRQLPAEETVSSYWRVHVGDLVFNPMWALEGGVAVSDMAGAVSPAYRVYELLRTTYGRFLHHWMRSKIALDQYRLLTRGITTFDRAVGREDLEGMPFPLPPLDEQRAIADFLDAETGRLDQLIEKHRRMTQLLEARLAPVAHALTTGSGGPRVALRRLVRQVKTGTTPPADVLEGLMDGDLPWYSPGDVEDSLRLGRPERRLQLDAVESGWVPLFPADSTLIVGIGATSGRVAHLEHEATGNQQMTCIVPGSRLLPRFLSWQLFARSDEIRATAPFSTMPILTNDFLRSLSIVVPSPEHQAQAVDRLNGQAAVTRDLVALIRRMVDLLLERRTALITAAVAGQLALPTGV